MKKITYYIGTAQVESYYAEAPPAVGTIKMVGGTEYLVHSVAEDKKTAQVSLVLNRAQA